MKQAESEAHDLKVLDVLSKFLGECRGRGRLHADSDRAEFRLIYEVSMTDREHRRIRVFTAINAQPLGVWEDDEYEDVSSTGEET